MIVFARILFIIRPKTSVRFLQLVLGCFLIVGPHCLLAQERTIKGVVLDSKNLPLELASVFIKNSTKGVHTNESGQFVIQAATGDTLVVYYTGFYTHESIIKDFTDKTIILEPSVFELTELIITTGYSEQRIKEITGSVAVVDPQTLTSIPAGQTDQMLQGRVAGLTVISSGMPGGKSNVRLHGIGNFGDVTPLYIIDGTPGDINNLQPQDISSIQVLKDAGSYAIYGVRGANGVILITTKKGIPGKSRLSYEVYSGFQLPVNKDLGILNPQEMADLTWLALKNSGEVGPNGNPFHIWYGNDAKPVLPDYLVAGPYQGIFATPDKVRPELYNIDFSAGELYQIVPSNKAGTSWLKEITRPAWSQNHTLTVSGGNQNNSHLLSLGYLDQQGTVDYTYLRRFSARINTSYGLGPGIKVGENLQLMWSNNPQITITDELFRAYTSPSILPVYDIAGNWATQYPDNLDENLVAIRQTARDNQSKSLIISGNVWAEAGFLNKFTARTQFGGFIDQNFDTRFNLLGYHGIGGLPANTYDESSAQFNSWTWTNTLRYDHTIASLHSVKLLLGTEALDNTTRESGAGVNGLAFNNIEYRFLSNGNPKSKTNYSRTMENTLFSLFGKLDYGFRDKYFVSATLRRDGSSVFGPQKRFGWFPSVSASWRISQEKFMNRNKAWTELKLRASYGITGFSGNTSPYNQFTLFGGGPADANYDIFGTSNNTVQGFRPTQIGELSTGWQQDKVLNVGIDADLWHQKLFFSLDGYNKISDGLLFPLTLPDILGGASPPNVNVGNVMNKGFDVLIGSRGKFSNHWSWDITLTGSKYRNKIIRLNDLPFFYPPDVPFVRNEVGHPVSSFYGYQVIGYFKNEEDVSSSPTQQAAAPGRFKYLDANGDHIINDLDRVHYGHPNPDFTLGLQLGFSYKSIDFSTFLYGTFGNEIVNVRRVFTDIYTSIPATAPSAKSRNALYNSWTPQNLNPKSPIAETSFNFSNLATYNSYFMEDGSYLKNKSLILGYTFPTSSLIKYKMSGLRVYVQAVNLFTLTSYTGLDPELVGQSAVFGVDFGNYPNNQKQFLFGLNVNF